MRIGLATGTPICDGLWIGAIVANVAGNVLAVAMSASDPLDASEWRCFARPDVMLSHGIGYVVHSDADRERVIRSWHRRCGRLDGCICEAAEQRVAMPRPACGIASPRLPQLGARARTDA